MVAGKVNTQFAQISLTKRFALFSLVILISGMLVIGWWVTKQIEYSVMNRTGSVAASYVNSVVSPELQSMSESSELDAAVMGILDGLLYETELGERIVSFKVWSRDGQIIYSPNRQMIGLTYDLGSDLREALEGKTVSHISDLSDPENFFERRDFTQLQETYTPIRAFGTGEIIGAVEFYESTESLAAEVQRGRVRTWLMIGGATLIMYLILVGMFKGASYTIARQRAELARVAARQESDRLKGEFVSSVSHELRTPLGFIKGYATTLLRDDITVDPDTRKEFLLTIEEESSKLQELIDDLLDMSRIQTGQLRIKPRTVNLSEFMEQATSRVSTSYQTTNKSRLIMHGDSNVEVTIDPARIEQVLGNLVENAAKYSDGDKSIEIDFGIRDEEVFISVKDHGSGISDDDKERIFDPFYRGTNAITRAIRGTGLGLSICRDIVHSHGGAIWVESNLGEGSTFILTIPLVVSDIAAESTTNGGPNSDVKGES